jgi:hypothetical protein
MASISNKKRKSNVSEDDFESIKSELIIIINEEAINRVHEKYRNKIIDIIKNVYTKLHIISKNKLITNDVLSINFEPPEHFIIEKDTFIYIGFKFNQCILNFDTLNSLKEMINLNCNTFIGFKDKLYIAFVFEKKMLQ